MGFVLLNLTYDRRTGRGVSMRLGTGRLGTGSSFKVTNCDLETGTRFPEKIQAVSGLTNMTRRPPQRLPVPI